MKAINWNAINLFCIIFPPGDIDVVNVGSKFGKYLIIEDRMASFVAVHVLSERCKNV